MRFKGTHFPGLAFLILVCLGFDAVYCYNRPPPRKTIFVPHDHDDSSPQQVHFFSALKSLNASRQKTVQSYSLL